MAQAKELSTGMTEAEFDNGYWYVNELKAFAKEIGIRNSSKLRKDQLETLIKEFIRTGKVAPLATTRKTSTTSKRDYELGLRPDLPIRNYTNNKITKQFIEKESLKMNPEHKTKSGAKYRLNRWREEQIAQGKQITYGDLVEQYAKLCETDEPFERIPHGRYINFVADYLENEEGATRDEAIRAWKQLKELGVPKDYESWKKATQGEAG